MTGGRYFRATDNRTLKAIYKEIDQFERSKIEVTAYNRYAELFYGWLAGGLILLVLEVGLSSIILKKIP
jgi:Ca-activated chloride channel family protein